jgi:nucleotide-binding universal stress UspA family protein
MTETVNSAHALVTARASARWRSLEEGIEVASMADIIVVGVDGSETALKAAQTAAALAARSGSALHVVSAFDSDAAAEIRVGSDSWLVSSADEAAQTAATVARKVGAPVTAVTSRSAQGKPADVLVGEAERLDARMIVIGNRRMQGVGRVLGSIANTVAHHAPCDVYIVKTF